MRPAQPRLPLEPLVRFVGLGESSGLLAEALRRNASTLRKYRISGIPEQEADNIAIDLGVHPSAIWGDAWFAIAERAQV